VRLFDAEANAGGNNDQRSAHPFRFTVDFN
jgi:hypothetical protein